MKITATSPLAWLENAFKDYKRPERCALPFDLMVAVCGRIDSPGPRDERFEYILDMGMPKIEKVLKGQPIGRGPHYFIFPDRWMVPAEAQIFVSKLDQNPDAQFFKQIWMVVHQPYIIGDCLKEQVRIIRNLE